MRRNDSDGVVFIIVAPILSIGVGYFVGGLFWVAGKAGDALWSLVS